MKPALFSLINAILLVLLGLWSYFGSEAKPLTAFIPVVFGIILLILNPGLSKQSKTIAHIAVFFTLLIFIGLFKPLTAQIDKGSVLGITRVSLMLLSTLIALISFVLSFINARKNKNE